MNNTCNPCTFISLEVKKTQEETEEDQILKTVLNFFPGAELEDVIGKSRKRELVIPRHLAIYFIRERRQSLLSLKKIGSIFGGRDHSTIHSSLKAVQDQLDTDRAYRFLFGRIQQALGARLCETELVIN